MVEIDVCTGFHEFAGLIIYDAGRDGDVAFLRNHDLYLYTALDGLFKGLTDGAVKGEVRVDELDALLGGVNEADKGVADDFGGSLWLPVGNADGFMAGAGSGVGLQPFQGVVGE